MTADKDARLAAEVDAMLKRGVEAGLFYTSTAERPAEPAPTAAEMISSFRALMRDIPPAPPEIRITLSAVAETTVRLFPESKHRSARIRKKLIKRHGGEFRREPTAYRIGNTIYMHPTLEAALRAATGEGSRDVRQPGESR